MSFWKCLIIVLMPSVGTFRPSTSSQNVIWSPKFWLKRLMPGQNFEIDGIATSVPDLIQRHGYPAETHTVHTDDSYLLILHRIPGGLTPDYDTGRRRQPVLLNHGIIASSAIWVLAGPGKGLAFVLADAGYDVWLGNLRGNTYSQYHATLAKGDFKFWDFSWDELAQFDVPAMIDYIDEVKSTETGVIQDPDLLYIGHSMGGTVCLGMLSTRLEYNTKVRAAFLLAPVAYMAGVSIPFSTLAPFAAQIQAMIRLSGSDEFFPHKSSGRYKAPLLGQNMKIFDSILIHITAGDKTKYEKAVLNELDKFLPAGASTKTARHYAQLILSKGKFQKYDYDREVNGVVYGQDEPPVYNLSAITVPIGMIYSDIDSLSTPQDVERAYSELAAKAGLLRIEKEVKFGHNEFTLGRRAPVLVNEPLLRLMDSFSDCKKCY